MTQVSDNMAIWDALGKTDPAHTKQFSRAGGFKGTALKPIWVERKLTEVFGPCGSGWGTFEPSFQLVTVGDEVLVYCTVQAWHTNPVHTLWGVGGDKVAAKNKYGLQIDDEAFKKAHTDAIMNAFKHIGVGADIHMGQFEDSKYLQEITREFAAEKAGQGQSNSTVSPDQPKRPAHSALKTAYRQFVHEANGCGDGDEWSAFMATPDSIKLISAVREKLPHIWDGNDWPEGQERPAEWEPLEYFINRRARECANATAQYLQA